MAFGKSFSEFWKGGPERRDPNYKVDATELGGAVNFQFSKMLDDFAERGFTDFLPNIQVPGWQKVIAQIKSAIPDIDFAKITPPVLEKIVDLMPSLDLPKVRGVKMHTVLLVVLSLAISACGGGSGGDKSGGRVDNEDTADDDAGIPYDDDDDTVDDDTLDDDVDDDTVDDDTLDDDTLDDDTVDDDDDDDTEPTTTTTTTTISSTSTTSNSTSTTLSSSTTVTVPTTTSTTTTTFPLLTLRDAILTPSGKVFPSSEEFFAVFTEEILYAPGADAYILVPGEGDLENWERIELREEMDQSLKLEPGKYFLVFEADGQTLEFAPFYIENNASKESSTSLQLNRSRTIKLDDADAVAGNVVERVRFTNSGNKIVTNLQFCESGKCYFYTEQGLINELAAEFGSNMTAQTIVNLSEWIAQRVNTEAPPIDSDVMGCLPRALWVNGFCSIQVAIMNHTVYRMSGGEHLTGSYVAEAHIPQWASPVDYSYDIVFDSYAGGAACQSKATGKFASLDQLFSDPTNYSCPVNDWGETKNGKSWQEYYYQWSTVNGSHGFVSPDITCADVPEGGFAIQPGETLDIQMKGYGHAIAPDCTYDYEDAEGAQNCSPPSDLALLTWTRGENENINLVGDHPAWTESVAPYVSSHISANFLSAGTVKGTIYLGSRSFNFDFAVEAGEQTVSLARFFQSYGQEIFHYVRIHIDSAPETEEGSVRIKTFGIFNPKILASDANNFDVTGDNIESLGVNIVKRTPESEQEFFPYVFVSSEQLEVYNKDVTGDSLKVLVLLSDRELTEDSVNDLSIVEGVEVTATADYDGDPESVAVEVKGKNPIKPIHGDHSVSGPASYLGLDFRNAEEVDVNFSGPQIGADGKIYICFDGNCDLPVGVIVVGGDLFDITVLEDGIPFKY